MTTVISIALAVFVAIFLVSCVLYWLKKPGFNKQVLGYSTMVIIVLIVLLVIALWVDGILFKDVQVHTYF
jgi:multisubunit Na+/H+ antiporter MnhF subunit